MKRTKIDTEVVEELSTDSGKVDAYAFQVKFRKGTRKAQRHTLRGTNKRLSARWPEVLARAEANTRALTGRSRF